MFPFLPLDETFDGVYEIEATAHAKDKVECYKELLRVVKPGGYFGSYEWCLTDKYDATNERHKELKWMIEIGDGLPDISTTDEVVAALKEAGWEVLEAEDMVYKEQDCHISWYDNLVPKYELSHNFQHTWLGRKVLAVSIFFFFPFSFLILFSNSYPLKTFVGALEVVGLAPGGTGDVSDFLNKAADGLVGGGETEVHFLIYIYSFLFPSCFLYIFNSYFLFRSSPPCSLLWLVSPLSPRTPTPSRTLPRRL